MKNLSSKIKHSTFFNEWHRVRLRGFSTLLTPYLNPFDPLHNASGIMEAFRITRIYVKKYSALFLFMPTCVWYFYGFEHFFCTFKINISNLLNGIFFPSFSVSSLTMQHFHFVYLYGLGYINKFRVTIFNMYAYTLFIFIFKWKLRQSLC